ncbi:hypothetical protein [Lentzea roselyniae]|uniref:hypothetical protein n=1 Tax=Lentzea roselyniae TaxID=531940 RepID=UPI001473A551
MRPIVPHEPTLRDEDPHDRGHNGQQQSGDEHSSDDLLAHGRMVARWAEQINAVHPNVHTKWKHQGKTRVRFASSTPTGSS